MGLLFLWLKCCKDLPLRESSFVSFYWAEPNRGSLRGNPAPLADPAPFLQSSVDTHKSQKKKRCHRGWLHSVRQTSLCANINRWWRCGVAGWGIWSFIELAAVGPYFKIKKHCVKSCYAHKLPCAFKNGNGFQKVISISPLPWDHTFTMGSGLGILRWKKEGREGGLTCSQGQAAPGISQAEQI